MSESKPRFLSVGDAQKAYIERKKTYEKLEKQRLEEEKLRNVELETQRIERNRQAREYQAKKATLIEKFKPAQIIMDHLKNKLETDEDICQKVLDENTLQLVVAKYDWNLGYSSIYDYPQILIDNGIDKFMAIEDFPYFLSIKRDIVKGQFKGWTLVGSRSLFSSFTHGLTITLEKIPGWGLF